MVWLLFCFNLALFQRHYVCPILCPLVTAKLAGVVASCRAVTGDLILPYIVCSQCWKSIRVGSVDTSYLGSFPSRGEGDGGSSSSSCSASAESLKKDSSSDACLGFRTLPEDPHALVNFLWMPCIQKFKTLTNKFLQSLVHVALFCCCYVSHNGNLIPRMCG